MKLELKHLKNYMDCNLMVIDCFGDKKELVGHRGRSGQYELMKYIELEYEWKSTFMSNFKPILRPLEDLEKEEFYFIHEVETDIESILMWLQLDIESRLSDKFSYEFWAMLFENHFDVFGLIEQGLAIDINTLES